MKIKVKDVRPNPYRNIDHYPLNKEKIMALTSSIEKTGFWDNLVGREENGEFQIAYGHHRIEALRLAKGYGYDFEFDLPIKKIGDASMIQIMANENMDEWGHSIVVIDETVKVAKSFLEDSETFLAGKKASKFKNSKAEKGVASGEDISDFLGWGKAKVFESLKRLNAIESGKIDKQAIESLPTPSHAKEFVSAVEKTNLTHKEQQTLAKEITSKGMGKRDVKDLVEKKSLDLKFPNTKVNKKAKAEAEAILTFRNFYGSIRNDAMELDDKVKELNNFTTEFKDAPYKQIKERVRVLECLTSLQGNIAKLIEDLRESS